MRVPGAAAIAQLDKLPQVLSQGELRVVYQPIVSLATLKTFAHETLVRSTSPNWTSPPRLFEEAIHSQCVGALGRAIRELSIRNCPDVPLFLNVHPNELDESWLVRPDDPIFSHDQPVYLEITESVPLTHFNYCHSVLREIRSRGVYLAVDDLGAGYSNLKYIADLAPEIVKLDRNLVADLGKDKRVFSLVKHIVRLCSDLGAKVVAEGIEEEDECLAAIDAGADFGQGYYFARPTYPPPAISEDALKAAGSHLRR
ncbi:MAG: EAL domain-containing protein [Polyangiales bacterium]